MTQPGDARFSLLGGPVHRLGVRLGLVLRGTDTLRLGWSIGVFLWVVLVLLALAEGFDLLSFMAIGAHARLLVAVPLFFACESLLDPRLADFIRVVERAAAAGGATPAMQAELARIARWRDAWWGDALCLVAAVVLSGAAAWWHIPGTVTGGAGLSGAEVTPAGWWYGAVCLPVVRFLLLRWLWRLGLWWWCLWRLSRLPLRLWPSHPDGVGGLGSLEIAHGHFVPLVLAGSILLATSFAVDLGGGAMALTDVYPALAVLLLLVAMLFVLPLCLFSPRLWACRLRGLARYSALAERYVTDFDAKWLPSPAHAVAPGAGEPLLGNPDVQSLADLSTSFNLVRDMRLAPVNLRLLAQLAVAALLPMLPLVLFEYPLTEITRGLVAKLIGV